MNELLKKLNFKEQRTFYVVNVPQELNVIIEQWKLSLQVLKQLPKPLELSDMVLIFVKHVSEIEHFAKILNTLVSEDSIIWFAYPKKSSKQYTCEFNRDTGWNSLGAAGFEGVRQVSIDEDWSALRFRRVRYIKQMKRSFAMSEEGKAKSAK